MGAELPAERSHSLPIRVRHTLAPDGTAFTSRSVYCPLRRRNLSLAECQHCEKCQGVTLSAGTEAGGFVICRLQETPGVEEAWTHLVQTILPSAADRTPISAAMSNEVTCVTPEVGLEVVHELFLERGYSSAPVVDDDGFPIGVIGKTDLLRERRPDAVVADAMMPIAFTLRETDPLSRAAALMSVEQVHHLPIVSEDGRVIGILSSLDLAGWMARQAGY